MVGRLTSILFIGVETIWSRCAVAKIPELESHQYDAFALDAGPKPAAGARAHRPPMAPRLIHFKHQIEMQRPDLGGDWSSCELFQCPKGDRQHHRVDASQAAHLSVCICLPPIPNGSE